MKTKQLTMQRIAAALKEQGGTEFQEFCDHFLRYKFPNRMSSSLYGAQLEIRNTTKGHPDSFFRLLDGRLYYVETTAQQTGLTKKIKKDIESAISEAKNHIYTGKLNLIFNLKVKHQKELDNLIFKLAEEHKINIQLNTLDLIAQEIFLFYPMLGKYLLGIVMDTGQIQPLEEFIEQYENRTHHLATPLTNSFLDRNGLHERISQLIENHDLIILDGAPGVGKTRTALEAIHSFQLKQPEYSAFAIVPKYRDLIDDLDQTLQKNKKYILFIDDANRQLANFHYALGSLLGKNAQIKIVISVRNYALKEVDGELADCNFKNFHIPEFSDVELLSVLESDTYQITDFQVKQQILKISQGKPRVAIMAAILVNKNGGKFPIENILSLYDAYFQEILRDVGFLNNQKILKALGIIAFFYTLDLSDRSLVAAILKGFNIELDPFMEAIHNLEHQEFVESHGTFIKISEQLLSTYFFFKVFIQQQLLSFEILQQCFYDKYYYRFRDVLTPILQTFPKEEAWNPIAPIIRRQLDSLEDEVPILEIFEICWSFMPDRVLSYLSKSIQQMREPENPEYKIVENHFSNFPGERKLRLLKEFLKEDSIYFIPALNLSWEYLRKNPKLGTYFIKIFEGVLMQYQPTLDQTNRKMKFYRSLDSNIDENHIQPLILPLIKAYFSTPWLPELLSQEHFILNTLVWDVVQKIALKRPAEFLKVFLEYDPEFRFRQPDMFYQDREYLFEIIQNQLRPDQIIENYVVNELLSSLEEMNELPKNWNNLKRLYQNDINTFNQALKWEQVMHYVEKNGENGYQESLLRQEVYLITTFKFSTIQEYEKFLDNIHMLFSFQLSGFWIERSLDLLVSAYFKKDSDFGFKMLEILQQRELNLIILSESVRTIFSQVSEKIPIYWNRLSQFPDKTRVHYQYRAVDNLSPAVIRKVYIHDLLENLESHEDFFYMDYKVFSKFEKYQENLFEKIVQLILKKNKEGYYFYMDDSFFIDYWENFKDKYSWIKTVYFSQKSIKKKPLTFDSRCLVLQKIIHHFPEFLCDLGLTFYPGDLHRIKYIHSRICFIWNSDTFFPWIEKLLNEIKTELGYFPSDNDYFKYIFTNDTDQQQANIHRFLQIYLLKNISDYRRIDLVFKAAKLLSTKYYKSLFIKYLQQKPDIEQFKKVYWINESGIHHGKVNWGAVLQKRWEVLKGYLNEIPITAELFPIREFIEVQIIYASNSSKHERLREFLRR